MRAYTVREVDDLREALKHKHFSEPIHDGMWCRTYGPGEMEAEKSRKVVHLEQLLRTAMTAGHTAEDIKSSYERSGGSWFVPDF